MPRWGPSPCGEGQQWQQFGFGIITRPLCIALSCASSNFQLCAQKCDHLPPPPPPNPYISEMTFSHRFQKVYIYPPPPREQYFGASDRKFRKPGKD